VKTQIIQLEAHDDTLSVRDKMDWSQTPRVLLIWPEKGKVLRARLDLILLERYCSAHGSQLALLTTDKEVIFQAGQAGIPVFHSRKEAQFQPWGKSFREFQRQDLENYAANRVPVVPFEREVPQSRKEYPRWIRISIFTAGILAILTLAAFLLPSAEITLLPQYNQHTLSIPVQAQPDRVQITLSGVVPARELMVLVEDQLSTPSTGSVPIPAEYARGEVVFTNLSQDEITIPPETILSTAGEKPILFRTLTGGSTPPEQGGQIILEVEAYLPGESGNIPANQITKINFEAGAELTVTNPSPTEGGSDIQIPAPTLVDRLKLAREMDQLLENQAREEIAQSITEEDVLLTTRLNEFELVKEEYSPQDAGPGELLWLDKSVQYLVHYAAAEDIYQLASDLVKAQYQDDSDIPALDSIQVQVTSPPVRKGSENYHWEVQVSWLDQQTLSRGYISQWITGHPATEAEQILLEKLDLEGSPQIILKPSWWPRIPWLPIRIQIIQGEN